MCLPVAVCTYLNQQEVSTLDKAAVLAVCVDAQGKL